MAVVMAAVMTTEADNNPQKSAAGVAKMAAVGVAGAEQQGPLRMLCSTCAKIGRGRVDVVFHVYQKFCMPICVARPNQMFDI